MTTVNNELIYEVLKQIQTDVAALHHGVKELKTGQSAIRKDIHRLDGNLLRIDDEFVSVNERLDRIEKQLSLVQA